MIFMSNPKQKIKNIGGKTKSRGPYKQDVFSEFVEWSVMTKKERVTSGIATAKIFAKKYKVHESHLSRWKQREEFRSYKEQRQRSKLQELTPDILEAFYKRCMKYGMSSDIELWLALVEKWDKKKVIEQKQDLQFGPNDIRVLIKHLPPEKQKHFYGTLVKLIADATEAEEKHRNDY